MSTTLTERLLAGRALIWLIQQSGLLRPVRRVALVDELISCDLCLGFWVYLGLNARHYRIADALSRAAVMTVAAHLLRLGWQAKFGVEIYD